jgi:D-sedoheptulose 7-phosphate isomerase
MTSEAIPTMSMGLSGYAHCIAAVVQAVEVTSAEGRPLDSTVTARRLAEVAREVHARGNKLVFIGNGGSAAIASHMATDFSKNGNVRALAFNDAAMLTCLGNDLGFERVFAKQIELHAREGDLVFAISSSGRSPDILAAVAAAQAACCTIVTLSGFSADNALRRMGEFNFYIDSDRYGFVEIGHLTICHAVLDLICGLSFTPG